MIVSFDDGTAEEFFNTGKIPRKNCRWMNVSRIVARKLDMLNAAAELSDLRSPPGNQLEALKGSLDGKFSIRVNDQWRIVFGWTDDGPEEVKVVDYH